MTVAFSGDDLFMPSFRPKHLDFELNCLTKYMFHPSCILINDVRNYVLSKLGGVIISLFLLEREQAGEGT